MICSTSINHINHDDDVIPGGIIKMKGWSIFFCEFDGDDDNITTTIIMIMTTTMPVIMTILMIMFMTITMTMIMTTTMP